MAYTKTTWTNDGAPPINDDNLNNMETGIGDAHDQLAIDQADIAKNTEDIESHNVQLSDTDTRVTNNENAISGLSAGEVPMGAFTPTSPVEYPVGANVNESWYVSDIGKNGYLFTGGDLAGKTAYDMDKMILASTGWSLISSNSNLTVSASAAGSLNDIGSAGAVGFGVSATNHIPAGWKPLPGFADAYSPNYGNAVDTHGSVMVFVPKFYFRWNADNSVDIANEATAGHVLHRAFKDGGLEKNGFWMDKYGCGNVGGVFISMEGLVPCSTSSANNPIADLTNTPANNYGGMYKAVATRGAGYNLPAIYQYQAIAILSFAQGKAATEPLACAFNDRSPILPKGNNNNALGDTNDGDLKFTSSGYPNAALAGSGVPVAKTTHNGQTCGIVDLNGNMYEVASGMVKFNNTDGIFAVLKESAVISDIVDDTTSGGAYDPLLYDDLDLTGFVAQTGTANRYGNGVNTVFEQPADEVSDTYKRTCFGVPKADGKSGGGSVEFGNDYFYEQWTNDFACLCGGSWGDTSYAGVFAVLLNYPRTNSNYTVGGRASFLV